jgi:beta-carotene ketolase (CrtO type)
LGSCIGAFGGEIRTEAPVQSILVEGERAGGVTLASGETLRANDVIAAVDPATLFGKLLDPALLPAGTRDELRAMSICEKNITYFTGHAALARRPHLPRHGRDSELLRAGYQMIVPTYESLKRSLDSAARGEIPDDLPIWLSYPSVCDRSLVPAGSDGETLYFMTPVTPYDLAGGRDWAQEKESFFDRVIDVVETYTAGVEDSIIDSYAVSPYDMSRWTTKGHACHIDMSLSQMGPWRPTPSLAGYETPIEALWQVSAGSHPLPSVNGWAGRTAARTLLRARRPVSVGRVRRGSDHLTGRAGPAQVSPLTPPWRCASPRPAPAAPATWRAAPADTRSTSLRVDRARTA